MEYHGMIKKKRNKPFNPNKKTSSELKELQRKAQIRKDAEHVYVLEKSFISKDIKDYVSDRQLKEKALIDRFPEATTVPYHITIGAYDYQDLAIAVVLSHFDEAVFTISAVISLFYEDEEQELTCTLNYDRVLPSMPYIDLIRGNKTAKIDHGNGLKTVGWSGYDVEVVKEINFHKEIPAEAKITSIYSTITADIKFKNANAYEEFLTVKQWISSSKALAEERLKQLWIAEQLAIAKQKKLGAVA